MGASEASGRRDDRPVRCDLPGGRRARGAEVVSSRGVASARETAGESVWAVGVTVKGRRRKSRTSAGGRAASRTSAEVTHSASLVYILAVNRSPSAIPPHPLDPLQGTGWVARCTPRYNASKVAIPECRNSLDLPHGPTK